MFATTNPILRMLVNFWNNDPLINLLDVFLKRLIDLFLANKNEKYNTPLREEQNQRGRQLP